MRVATAVFAAAALVGFLTEASSVRAKNLVSSRLRSQARVRVTTVSDPDSSVSVTSLNPYPRDSYDWWVYSLENRLVIPANETFVSTHTCECDCAVADPSAADPIKCACNCPVLPQGIAGEQGKDGEAGEQGLRGPQGPRGEPGDEGPPGSIGAKGDQGERGKQGPQGAPGASGRPGRSIPGPEGPPGADGGLVFGPTGPRGPPGPRGFKGSKGQPGEDVTGSLGPRGLTGEPGDLGERGLTGAQGPVGPRGVAGPRGITGPSYEKWQVNNLLGQITAQSACVSAMKDSEVGFVSAVLRDCASGLDCNQICEELSIKDTSLPKGKCSESIHVFAAASRGDDKSATGLLTRRFGDCTDKGCGPNTCCCIFGTRNE